MVKKIFQLVTGVQLYHELEKDINEEEYIRVHQNINGKDNNYQRDNTYIIRDLYFEPSIEEIGEDIFQQPSTSKYNEEFWISFRYDYHYSKIVLNKKCCVNGMSSDQTVEISKQQCKDILNGKVEWMRNSEEALIVEFYVKMQMQNLKPGIIREYVRETYHLEENVSVMIDQNIGIGFDQKSLFHYDIPIYSTIVNYVLKIRYSGTIPADVRSIACLA
ncbi:MAG: VTC domain-containing protein [Lachnospiraceae bacterium]